MRKEQFIESMTLLENQSKLDVRSANDLGKVFPNAHVANLLPSNSLITEGYIDLLSFIMGDTNKWIEYYIYELDFGSKYKDGCVSDSSGNIKLGSIEDLYNLLKD